MPGTTDLDSDFAAFKAQRGVIRCYVCKADPAVRDWIEKQLHNGEPRAAVAEFLKAQGFDIGPSAIRNHWSQHVSG